MSKEPETLVITVNDLDEIYNDRDIIDSFDNSYTQIVTFELSGNDSKHHGSSLTFSNISGHFMLDKIIRKKDNKADGGQLITEYSQNGQIRETTNSVFHDNQFVSEQLDTN